MDALRTATSLLALYDPDEGDESMEANKRKALRLTAQMGTLVATLDRLRKGEDPVAPKPGLSTAASFLYQLTGRGAERDRVARPGRGPCPPRRP